MLEAELTQGDEQGFDILAIDAFSSGSIPVHLLTREAADIYRQHLDPDGFLVLHVSNHFLDLPPVVRGLARHLEMEYILFDTAENVEELAYASTWMIVTRNREFLSRLDTRMFLRTESQSPSRELLWTDKYASLWQVVMF